MDLSPETGPAALNVRDLTASREAVTMEARTPVPEMRNEYLAKLWQFPAAVDDGTPRRGRVSCNRGEQLSAAAAAGTQVLWLDATTGVSDVVTRTKGRQVRLTCSGPDGRPGGRRAAGPPTATGDRGSAGAPRDDGRDPHSAAARPSCATRSRMNLLTLPAPRTPPALR
ncbi:hypothetical protein SGLAM104S_04108 [Streptomyces glaucescens]